MAADEDPTLFDGPMYPDPPTTRRTDPETSYLAAGDARRHAVRDRDRVLAAYRTVGPMTDYELAALLGGQQNSLGKRRGELRDAGLVEYAGYHRPAPSGSMARVWKATE